jgi:hypothetical protein
MLMVSAVAQFDVGNEAHRFQASPMSVVFPTPPANVVNTPMEVRTYTGQFKRAPKSPYVSLSAKINLAAKGGC